jgi:hypothetical protein
MCDMGVSPVVSVDARAGRPHQDEARNMMTRSQCETGATPVISADTRARRPRHEELIRARLTIRGAV